MKANKGLIEAVIRSIADKNGTTPGKVREEIQATIDLTWDSLEPKAKKRQIELFGPQKPTVDSFILGLVDSVRDNYYEKSE